MSDNISTKSGHDTSIDGLKALMLLGIFLHHSFCTTPPVAQYQAVNVINSLISAIPVCVLGAFFLISGYFTTTKQPGTAGYTDLLKRRFVGLLIPFFVWNIIYIAVFIVSAKFMPVMQQKVETLGLNTWGGIASAFFGIPGRPADNPMWYIRNLFYCIALYPLIRFFCRGKFGWIFPLAAAIGLGLLYNRLPIEAREHARAYILPSFCLGVWMRENKISLHCFEHGFAAVFAIVTFLGFYVATFYFDLKVFTWIADCRLSYLLFIPGALFFAKFCSYTPGGKWDKAVVQPSFFIYASHALFGTAMLRIILPRVPESPYYLLVAGGLFFVGGGILLYLAYLLLQRFAPGLFSILAGKIRSVNFGENFSADIARCRDQNGRFICADLPALIAVAIYRYGSWAARKKYKLIRFILYIPYFPLVCISSLATGIQIPKSTKIGPGLKIHHWGTLIINGNATIGANCTLRPMVVIGNLHDGLDVPTIGNNVSIGAGAKILGNITIGDNVKIGANAVVVKNIPADSTAVGIPAKTIDKA